MFLLFVSFWTLQIEREEFDRLIVWRHVKEKQNNMKFDLRNVSAKNIKKQKQKAYISFKSIIFIKKLILSLL